eukprot:COSAG01_NODE_2465_length_7642_cov_11.032878_3_plen_163_part_00
MPSFLAMERGVSHSPRGGLCPPPHLQVQSSCCARDGSLSSQSSTSTWASPRCGGGGNSPAAAGLAWASTRSRIGPISCQLGATAKTRFKARICLLSLASTSRHLLRTTAGVCMTQTPQSYLVQWSRQLGAVHGSKNGLVCPTPLSDRARMSVSVCVCLCLSV